MSDSPDHAREHIVLKKYPNRRLYDTVHSRYVNLKDISELVKDGHTVEVTETATGADLTKVILTQIILEEEKGQKNLLPTEFLHRLIAFGESAYEEFLREFVAAGMDAYRTAQTQVEQVYRQWLGPWTGAPTSQPPSEREVAALRARVAELESRLAATQGRETKQK